LLQQQFFIGIKSTLTDASGAYQILGINPGSATADPQFPPPQVSSAFSSCNFTATVSPTPTFA
jgi:hypothetical protein